MPFAAADQDTTLERKLFLKGHLLRVYMGCTVVEVGVQLAVHWQAIPEQGKTVLRNLHTVL